MCYRTSCKETCDDLKKMYCIMKITKKQHEFMKDVLNNYCQQCGDMTVKAKYKNEIIDLCTSCRVLNNQIEGEVS